MAKSFWCPRCGDWRGALRPICAGCAQIEDHLLTLPGVDRDEGKFICFSTPDATLEQKQALIRTRAELVQKRFEAISGKRTEREAYTQTLEDFVDEFSGTLHTIAYRWGELRRDAMRTRFSNIYAFEMTSSMQMALTELANMSAELAKYDRNPPRHEETLERIRFWQENLNKFREPDASSTEGEPDSSAGKEDDDEAN